MADKDDLNRMVYRDSLNRDQPVKDLDLDLGDWLEALRTTVDECRTAILELIDDHATAKAERDELHTWAEALTTKLNADDGVTDTDYDTEIAAATTETLAASDPTAAPSSLA